MKALRLALFFIFMLVFAFCFYVQLYAIAGIAAFFAALTAFFTAPIKPGGPIR